MRSKHVGKQVRSGKGTVNGSLGETLRRSAAPNRFTVEARDSLVALGPRGHGAGLLPRYRFAGR